MVRGYLDVHLRYLGGLLGSVFLLLNGDTWMRFECILAKNWQYLIYVVPRRKCVLYVAFFLAIWGKAMDLLGVDVLCV